MNNDLPAIGKRIRDLRLAKDMTQEELGALIGKTTATVNKYELGTVKNLPRDVVESLSRALECHPGYLMLWYDRPDGPKSNAVSPLNSEEEKELIRIYRALPVKSRLALLQKAYELESN